MRAPLGPTQHRLCLMGDGWWREIRLVVSRIAAVVPEAKSRRPATGLATVPMIPLPTPKKNPYLFEECVGREGVWRVCKKECMGRMCGGA